MSTNPQLFDVCLNLVGVCGIWPVIRRLFKEKNQNPLEHILKWLLYIIFIFWSVRFFDGIFENAFLAGLVYVLAILFAFCMCLLFEVLLRRHFPLWFKAYMLIGCGGFVILALVTKLATYRENLLAFGAYILSLQIVILAFCLARNRKEYSRSENATINASLVSLFLLVPFFLTDVESFRLEAIPKLGVCGGLIFVYISVYNQALFSGKGILLKRLSQSFLFAAAITLMVSFLIGSTDIAVLERICVLSFCIHIIYRLYFAIYYLSGEDEMHQFVRDLNRAPKGSVLEFLGSINNRYKKFDATLLSDKNISAPALSEIIKFFESKKMVVVSRFEISEWLNERGSRWSSADFDAMEKILDILETSERSHFCNLGTAQNHFAIFNCPFVSYKRLIESQTDLISQTAQLIEKRV